MNGSASSSSSKLRDEQPTTTLQVWLLGLLFPFIWLIDTDWWKLSPTVIVVVALLPLAWQLAKTHPARQRPSCHGSIWAVILLAAGIILQQMTLMAFSWSWLAVAHLLPAHRLPNGRVWLLLVGAFPWALADAQLVGWWFRLTAAELTGTVFSMAGFEVQSMGTQLHVSGLPISIEAACGGMRLMQLMLSGGIALTFIRFHRARGFWWMVAMLPLLVWTANTLRVIVITGWGLRFGADSAAGAFHTWGALVVVAALLGVFVPTSSLIRRLCNPEP